MQHLAEEEQKEEMERQQQTELERKLRRRIEARQAHRDQMADRMKRLQQEAQDEARYKQQVNMYEVMGSTCMIWSRFVIIFYIVLCILKWFMKSLRSHVI